MGGVWFFFGGANSRPGGGGGCKSKFSSLQSDKVMFFPFVRNSRPGGGGGVQMEFFRPDRPRLPPVGEVSDFGPGGSKTNPWGG